jgi:hypothetical protein
VERSIRQVATCRRARQPPQNPTVPRVWYSCRLAMKGTWEDYYDTNVHQPRLSLIATRLCNVFHLFSGRESKKRQCISVTLHQNEFHKSCLVIGVMVGEPLCIASRLQPFFSPIANFMTDQSESCQILGVLRHCILPSRMIYEHLPLARKLSCEGTQSTQRKSSVDPCLRKCLVQNMTKKKTV